MKQDTIATTSVPMKVVRWPNTETSQAFSSMVATWLAKNAVAIHCALSWPTPKAPMTLGTATATLVDESTIETMASSTAPVTSHR